MCGSRRTATASPTSCRRHRFPKTNTKRRCSSCPRPAAPPTRLGESIRIFNVPTPRPQLRWSPDGSMISVVAFEGGRPQVFGVPASGAAPQALTGGAGGRVRVRVVAGRQEPRLHHARSDAGRRGAAAAGPVVRHPRGRAGPRRRGSMVQRLDGSAPRALTPPSQYVDALSWSPDGREIAYSAAPRTGFTAAYDARVYAVAVDGGAAADDRRSPRHEHRTALFAGRPADRVHLDQRPHRHHGDAQPDPRPGGRRHAAHLRARRCVGERVRVGARQPLDLPAGQRRHVRTRRSTCSSSRSFD